jgi:chemotaxis protein methyltransferase CheR
MKVELLRDLMNSLIGEAVRLVRTRYKKDISVFDESFLEKTITKRCTAALLDTESYLLFLANDPDEMQVLIDSLNISYSEFFRNPFVFAVLEQWILPTLIDKKMQRSHAEVRIWSAGCARGQEAYSIAILLEDYAQTHKKEIPFRIFATDLSESELAAARQGIFESTAVQNVPAKYLRRYFTQAGDNYHILPGIKQRIDFSVYDLLDNESSCPPVSIYGNFDLVVCSNLLFYYRHEVQLDILDKIHRCLTPDSFLITGEAEKAIVEAMDGFRAISIPACIFNIRG